jgi:hypothetical protein
MRIPSKNNKQQQLFQIFEFNFNCILVDLHLKLLHNIYI